MLGRELLAPEEQKCEVAGRALEVDVPRELDGYGEAALHVTRAETVHRAVDDSARDVVLCGDRVVVRH